MRKTRVFGQLLGVQLGGALPGDGDGDVNAEHAGQDCGGRSVASWNSSVEWDFPGCRPERS